MPTQANNPVENQLTASAGRETIALALFDGAAQHYGLPGDQRTLLQAAARFYEHAAQSGGGKLARAARDRALAEPLEGIDAETQCIIASIVAFQGDRIKRDQELAFLRLNDDDQKTALRLAAMLAIAEVLVVNRVDLMLQPSRNGNGELTLVIGGERAAQAAEATTERDWRWLETLGPLTIRTAAPGEILPPLPAPDSSSGFQIEAMPAIPPGEQPFAESARRALRRQFEKMLARESDVRGGEDAEDVHQMRVATRRLRASLQVVAPAFDPDIIRVFRRKLRATAVALGGVRDSDVFLDHLRSYRETLASARKASLDELIGRVEAERAMARTALLAELDSKRYHRFKHSFARFLTTPNAQVRLKADHGGVLRVRDLAGSLIWHRYEDMRSYEVLLSNAPDHQLHQMRIAGKRLRYTLEFFAEALGDGVDACLDPLAALQEVLGSLQDSVVARERITRLGLENSPGARSYLARREAERNRLFRQLPVRWERVNRPVYRRKLFELIMAL